MNIFARQLLLKGGTPQGIVYWPPKQQIDPKDPLWPVGRPEDFEPLAPRRVSIEEFDGDMRRAKMKIVTWTVVRINCGCSAYTTAKRRFPPSHGFPRCQFCKRSLGHMDFQILGKTRARSEYEAVSTIQAERRLAKP